MTAIPLLFVGNPNLTPEASAVIQIDSTTQGALPVPRMTTVQRDAIVSPATLLMIANTTTGAYNIYNGAAWVSLGSSGGGAPADATYLTQTPSSGLSAEQALSLLATGLMQVTAATGVVSSVTTSAGLAALISDETGSGALVFGTSPTLGTPTIADLTNATHTHQNNAGGGTLNASAIAAGTLALARGGTNADLSASGSATAILAQDASHIVSARALVAADIAAALLNTAAGSVSAPSISFTGDNDTGIYNGAANEVNFAAGGVMAGKFSLGTTERRLTVGDGTNAAQLFFSGAAGAVRDFAYQSAGSNRLILRLDSTAESGANAGSNFVVLTRADDGTAVNNNALSILRSSGAVGINVAAASITARLHVKGSVDEVQGLFVANATQTNPVVRATTSAALDLLTIANSGLATHTFRDSGTNAVVNAVVIDYESSGSPAAGYGSALVFQGKDSTTPSTQMARLRSLYTTVTHASFATRSVLSASDFGAERDVIGWGANGTNGLLGFYATKAAAPIVQPSTTGTTTGFTAGAGTGVVSGSTFTGNSGATAYTIGDIVLALKSLGLLAA